MKVIRHEKTPRTWEMPLSSDPGRFWVTRRLELILEKGDRLKEVAKHVRLALGVTPKQALQIAAYYFDLGENGRKRSGIPWDKRDVRSERRYLRRRGSRA